MGYKGVCLCLIPDLPLCHHFIFLDLYATINLHHLVLLSLGQVSSSEPETVVGRERQFSVLRKQRSVLEDYCVLCGSD